MEGIETVATTGRRRITWVKRVPPKKYEWGKGAPLSGLLTTALETNLRGKPAMRYTVREMETDERFFFYGTVQLNEQLEPADVGHYVLITCTGEDTHAGRNGNPMKLFEVSVSVETAPGYANNGTPITDEDLPPMDSY